MSGSHASGWFTQIALSLGTLLVFVSPMVVGAFLHLDPDAVRYLLTADAVLLALLGLAIGFLSTRRNVYRRAFLVTAGLAPFILIAAELSLSLWRLREVDKWRTERIERVHEPHPTLGWRPIPNGKGRHVSKGNFDVVYETDAMGRKAISPNIDGAPTLHVFGDSYVFGHGVGNDDTALNVLARGFGAERGFNVVNYAVMGFGLEQMVMRLNERRDLVEQGDMVLFAPMSFDLRRNMIDRRFLCRFPVRGNYPLGAVKMRVGGRWESIDLASACASSENRWLQAQFLAGLVYHAIRDRVIHQELIENADAIFREAHALAKNAGAEFSLLFLAAPWECARGKHDFDIAGLQSSYSSMIDSCPEFDMRFEGDSHWTPRAHQWVAQFIGGAIASWANSDGSDDSGESWSLGSASPLERARDEWPGQRRQGR